VDLRHPRGLFLLDGLTRSLSQGWTIMQSTVCAPMQSTSIALCIACFALRLSSSFLRARAHTHTSRH
jgi:hypothetical protein